MNSSPYCKFRRVWTMQQKQARVSSPGCNHLTLCTEQQHCVLHPWASVSSRTWLSSCATIKMSHSKPEAHFPSCAMINGLLYHPLQPGGHVKLKQLGQKNKTNKQKKNLHLALSWQATFKSPPGWARLGVPVWDWASERAWLGKFIIK